MFKGFGQDDRLHGQLHGNAESPSAAAHWLCFCSNLSFFPSCRLSDQEKVQISVQLDALKETYDQLCCDSTEQLQQLQRHMAQEMAHKVALFPLPLFSTFLAFFPQW